MVNMPMPTPSMSMPMPMMSGPAPQPTDVPTNATFNSVGMNMMFNSVVSARTAAELNEVYDPNAGVDGVSRFDNSLSSNIRRSYYFNVRLRKCGAHSHMLSVHCTGCVWCCGDSIILLMCACNEECMNYQYLE